MQIKIKRSGFVAIMLFFGLLNLSIAIEQDEHAHEVQACADNGVGDACTFTDSTGNNISGSCHYDPNNKNSLLCVPIKQ